MPQMAPILWTVVSAFFYLALILFVVKLYFFTTKALAPASPRQGKTQATTWQW